MYLQKQHMIANCIFKKCIYKCTFKKMNQCTIFKGLIVLQNRFGFWNFYYLFCNDLSTRGPFTYYASTLRGRGVKNFPKCAYL